MEEVHERHSDAGMDEAGGWQVVWLPHGNRSCPYNIDKNRYRTETLVKRLSTHTFNLKEFNIKTTTTFLLRNILSLTNVVKTVKSCIRFN